MTAALIGFTCAGCGNGHGNQGQVLRALGFFTGTQDAGSSAGGGAGGNEDAPTAKANAPDSGRSVSFSQVAAVPDDPDNDGDTDGCFVGLINNQGAAAITTDGAQLVYSVQNSNLQIPNDFFPFSLTIPASGPSGGDPVFGQVQVVSPSTINFMRNNSKSLPPPPFALTVTVTVTGRSDTGVSYASNPITYNVTFTD